MTDSRHHPRLAVLYLVAVTLAAFAVPAWSATAPLRWSLLPSPLGLEIVLLLAAGMPPAEIARTALRLRWLFLFLLATYLLLPSETSAQDDIVRAPIVPGWRAVAFNVTGLAV